MMNEYPKACVILGAGASFDIKDNGAPFIDKEWQPPLAKQLFDIEKHNCYWDILDKYPGAKYLTQLLSPIISSEQISIEKALGKYAEHPDPQIREHYKHIPAYLRDLIFQATNNYTPIPSNYIRLVTELISEHPHNTLFIVLNYDNLLESALTCYDPRRYKFSETRDYMIDDRQAKVLKLHGSVNWFRKISTNNIQNWFEAVTKFDIFSPLLTNEILIKDNVISVSDPTEEGFYYPIITAPIANKGLLNSTCPDAHIEKAKEFLSTCRKFLIIGNSGLDIDLLELIDSSINSRVTPFIHLVDYFKGADNANSQYQRGIKAFRGQLIEENICKEGFRVYLNKKIHSFCGCDSRS